MIDLLQLKEIEDYLSKQEFENKSIQVIKIKHLITDLISGKDISVELKELFPEDENTCRLISTSSINDAELLLQVLESCDEDVLMMLEKKFSENSKITKIIRERIRNIPPENITEQTAIMNIEAMFEESRRSGNQLYQYICDRMSERGYNTDADFYKTILMSRQNFGRIRNSQKGIGKYCLLWIAVGLQLDYAQVVEMLRIAGFCFKQNDKSDIVISYIIKNIKKYDLDLVNDYLYHFGLKTFCE